MPRIWFFLGLTVGLLIFIGIPLARADHDECVEQNPALGIACRKPASTCSCSGHSYYADVCGCQTTRPSTGDICSLCCREGWRLVPFGDVFWCVLSVPLGGGFFNMEKPQCSNPGQCYSQQVQEMLTKQGQTLVPAKTFSSSAVLKSRLLNRRQRSSSPGLGGEFMVTQRLAPAVFIKETKQEPQQEIQTRTTRKSESKTEKTLSSVRPRKQCQCVKSACSLEPYQQAYGGGKRISITGFNYRWWPAGQKLDFGMEKAQFVICRLLLGLPDRNCQGGSQCFPINPVASNGRHD